MKGSYYANPVVDEPNVSAELKQAYPQYYGKNICAHRLLLVCISIVMTDVDLQGLAIRRRSLISSKHSRSLAGKITTDRTVHREQPH